MYKILNNIYETPELLSQIAISIPHRLLRNFTYLQSLSGKLIVLKILLYAVLQTLLMRLSQNWEKNNNNPTNQVIIAQLDIMKMKVKKVTCNIVAFLWDQSLPDWPTSNQTLHFLEQMSSRDIYSLLPQLQTKGTCSITITRHSNPVA